MQIGLTEDSDASEQQPMGLEAQNSSSATEPSLTLESTSHYRVQVRKKKNKIQPSLKPAPEAEAPKSKKRKKDSIKKAPANVEAPADKSFQCRNCPFSGQKIVRHYVTKHPDLEIPFATVPASKWVALSSNVSFEDSSRHHPVNSDLFADLSWIPTQSNLKELTHCKLCPYSSCIPSELLEHFILHALPVNCHYLCHLCDHREANFFDILDHVTGHTGEYRYRCSHCDFRVDSRTGIKQHMSSHHASEDVLDYSTSLPNVKQLWIFGFVCINCHFVQMDFEQLERHVKNNTSCSSYFKVSMISTVCDNSVFNWCDTREKRKNSENFHSFIAKKLRGHRSSTTWIQNLGEKPSTVEALGNSLVKEEPHSDEPSFISQLESPNETRMVVASIAPRSLSREQGLSSGLAPGVPGLRVSRKPTETHGNTGLDSTISKLAEQVGNLSSSLPEELFDEDSSYCDSPVSYDDDDDDDMESCSTETEEVVDGGNISIKHEDVEPEIEVKTEICGISGYLQIENVISLTTNDDDDCLDPIQSDMVSNVTIRKGEITFPYPIAHDRPAFAPQLKDKQSYLSMMQRDRVRNFYKCMAYRCMFSSQSTKDFSNHLIWHYRKYLVSINTISILTTMLV